MDNIEPILYPDPQCRKEQRCTLCGSCVYPPTYFCIRCERGNTHDIGRT